LSRWAILIVAHHFYSHRHPGAAFVNHLVVSRLLAGETRSLRDLEYWVLTDSERRTTQLGDSDQLKHVLVEELGVQVSDEESRRLYDGLDT
jgi:N-hydroxyarylamine O-acetyltransferase